MTKSNSKTKRDSKPRIALAPSTNIALDRLVISDANVRQVKNGVSIEALAESIARRSLLQSLSVRPILDDDGAETGRYEVQAGGRRLRALQLLVQQKRLTKDVPVPCIVKTTGIIEDDSLAENTDREALHPLDQFRAFAALRVKGQTEEDIAAAYLVTPAVVRQRLKLASASPKLLEAYAADALNLEQLMAFCVTDDHARQEQVWGTVEQGQTYGGASNIRRLLTETAIEADDPRARFVGVDTYVAAGGTIMRDLFHDDDGGWLQDPALLMRLVSEKLAVAREAVLAQGWKWAEACLETPYAMKQGLRRLQPIETPLSEEEQLQYEALATEYDALVESLSDEEEIDEQAKARLDAIETEMAALENRPPKYAPEDIARGGVLLSVGHNGKLNIEYGFLRPEDDAPRSQAETGIPGAPVDDRDDDGEHRAMPGGDDDEMETAGKSLSDRLIQDLTSYRTVALRNALAQDFDTAFLAALHALCLKLFYHYGASSCLQINANSHFPANAPGLGDLVAAKEIEARHQHWQSKLPEDGTDLWDALVELNRGGGLSDLFAHCVSLTINAVREPHQQRREETRHADVLAAALGLDMVQAGWVTTAENYLGRVTKAHILEAVSEAKGDSTARLIEHLKKADMAKEAERLLQSTGWLPEALRTAGADAPRSTPCDDTTAPASSDTLPPFLTDGMAGDQQTALPRAQ